MVPDLEFLALNAAADHALLAQHVNSHVLPMHTVNEWAMFKQTVSSPITMSIPVDIPISSTAFGVGVHFSPQTGVNFICQCALHRYHSHEIVYENFSGPHHPDNVSPDTDTDTVEIFYNPLHFSRGAVQSLAASVGLDTNLPAKATSQYTVALDDVTQCLYEKSVAMDTGAVAWKFIDRPTIEDMYHALIYADEDLGAYDEY